MLVLSQLHSIIFDRGISAPGNSKELVDGINAIDNRYMYQLMSTVQLSGSIVLENLFQCILAHQKRMTVWLNNFKKICLKIILNMESLIRRNTENIQ